MIPDGVVLPIGLIEITSVILYVFPRTSMLGAILASAYLGGACATHIHAGHHPFRRQNHRATCGTCRQGVMAHP
jgi:hypothetical protein